MVQGGDIFSVLHKTDNDDDEHGPVKEVDYDKWEDETKPEGIHDYPAAMNRKKDIMQELMLACCLFVYTEVNTG